MSSNLPLEIDDLIDREEIDQAMLKIEELRACLDKDDPLCLKYQILKCKMLNEKGRYKETILCAQEVIKYHKSHDPSFITIDAYLEIGKALWRLGKLDESLQIITNAQKILNVLTVEKNLKIEREAYIFKLFGVVNWTRGNLNASLNYSSKALEGFETVGNKEEIAHVINNLGVVYQDQGEYDLALEHYEKSLKIRQQIGKKIGIAIALNNLGVVYQEKGQLDKALDYYQQSLKIRQELGNENFISTSLNNIGEIYQLKGQINVALDYYTRSLELREKLGNSQLIAFSLLSIGSAMLVQGKLNDAFEKFQRSLKLLKEVGNDINISESLFQLVLLAEEKRDYSQMRAYYQDLVSIYKNNRNLLIKQRYEISRGVLLKNQRRIKFLSEAEQIFTRTIENEHLSNQLRVLTMTHLFELFLFELSVLNDPDIIQDISFLANQLLGIAKIQNSPSIIVETYILLAKLELLELNVRRAEYLLSQANYYAEEMRATYLVTKVIQEQELLNSRRELWNKLRERSASIRERLEFIDLQKTINVIQAANPTLAMGSKPPRLDIDQIKSEGITRYQIEQICKLISTMLSLMKKQLSNYAMDAKFREINTKIKTLKLGKFFQYNHNRYTLQLLKIRELDHTKPDDLLDTLVSFYSKVEKIIIDCLPSNWLSFLFEVYKELQNKYQKITKDFKWFIFLSSQLQPSTFTYAFQQTQNITDERFLFEQRLMALYSFKMGDLGVEPIAHIGSPILDETSVYKHGTFIITSLGLGSEYHTGLFGPLPVTGDSRYESLHFAMILKDIKNKDPRLQERNYSIISVIYHKSLSKMFLHFRDSVEKIIIKHLKGLEQADEVKMTILKAIFDDIRQDINQ